MQVRRLARETSRLHSIPFGALACAGNQFCGFGLAETKARAVKVVEALQEQLELPRPVRIHFTGCPNSCGQAQVRMTE